MLCLVDVVEEVLVLCLVVSFGVVSSYLVS